MMKFHCGLTEFRLINNLTEGERNKDCVCGSCLAVSTGKEQVNSNSG